MYSISVLPLFIIMIKHSLYGFIQKTWVAILIRLWRPDKRVGCVYIDDAGGHEIFYESIPISANKTEMYSENIDHATMKLFCCSFDLTSDL